MAAEQPIQQPPGTVPGPQPIPPALRKRLQRCYERGKQLAEQDKPDFDYAHTMFTECVVNDPSNLEYTEALLSNLQRKFNNNKKGARLKGFGSRNAFKKAVASKDWPQTFRQGCELLKANPWDVATLRALAGACQANHYNEVELRYLKNALDFNSKDLDVNRHCAESLARMGQFDQAIACWHRIEELDKGNEDARKKISELTLAKTMGVPGVESQAPKPAADASRAPQAGGDPSGNSTAVAESHDKVDATAAKPSREQLEQTLEGDPSDIDSLLQLAELHTAEHRYRDAFQCYKRALDAGGGSNLQVRELLEESQIRMIRAQVLIAEKRAAADQTAEAADLARRFRVELNRQELQVFSARVERYPTNLKLKYELALRLKREGNYRESVKYFDESRHDSNLRVPATVEMGECFQHLKQYGNALKCYQNAAEASNGDPEIRKLALYRAGVLSAALKKSDSAENYFTQLLQLDADYKDASSRLDKLRQMHDKD